MTVNTCPDQDLLRNYLQGSVSGPDVEMLEDHLSACPDCQDTIDALEDGSVPDLIQLAGVKPEKDGEAADPLLRAMVTRAKSILGPEREFAGLNSMSKPAMTSGTVFGNYELLELIGQGGMGQVYKACHRRMKRTVAVKFLPQHLFATAELRSRFDREIETAARLSHTNVVTAFDAGEVEGQPFLVMEHVNGVDLARHVQRLGPMPIGQALQCIVQAARALAYAHAHGIVHRDIKPANLLLDAQGTVKVSDLGLARLLARSESRDQGGLSRHSGIMGTAAYMAPEQALDARTADCRADIYSLGCTLFYLLRGNPPFAGKTTLETIYAHRDQPVPTLRVTRPDCPPALDALIGKMLAKRPEDRFASMTEVIEALAPLVADATDTERDSVQTHPDTTRISSATLRKSAWLQRWWIAAIPLTAAAVVLAILNPFEAEPSGDGPTLGASGSAAKPLTETSTPIKKLMSGPLVNPGLPGSHGVEKPQPPLVEMVLIEAGDFMMGASDTDDMAEKDEKPQHKVTISTPFFLGKFEVTQRQFQDVMGTNPSAFRADGRFKNKMAGVDTSSHPVECATWFDAIKFCNRLSEMHSIDPYYLIENGKVKVKGGTGYRLPTEAEWEYSCRGGTTTIWSFGNDHSGKLKQHAWFAQNSDGKTYPVGQLKPNPFGLYDMHGNVPEWCWDFYDAEYYRKGGKVFDPAGPATGDDRVYRGGGWDLGLQKTRSTARTPIRFLTYGDYLTLVGFRVAKNAE